MDIGIVLAFLFGLFLLYIVGMLLVIPIKLIIKLVINGVLGGILLLVVNFIGGFIGFSIVINPLTAVIAGIFGIPGVILLILLQYIL
ncbi:pro-sigmaK processing inhibitor BofA family protein [Schnuerera sp. xch1]|uniref:pro-sigmaK processing inhibitor BofA family protein n=1 Tax=Schnuerera sp. xch1 TaxID=2874283 RepID=UPI001CC0A5B0|nr:pro-sigmaK processing inhibitor BofA family protein [Schnuerera sp. xch1]MBZ2175040.1 pro-sigmaK processing inhibitor BofA family protein [Schnuerera sp. xch1]